MSVDDFFALKYGAFKYKTQRNAISFGLADHVTSFSSISKYGVLGAIATCLLVVRAMTNVRWVIFSVDDLPVIPFKCSCLYWKNWLYISSCSHFWQGHNSAMRDVWDWSWIGKNLKRMRWKFITSCLGNLLSVPRWCVYETNQVVSHYLNVPSIASIPYQLV